MARNLTDLHRGKRKNEKKPDRFINLIFVTGKPTFCCKVTPWPSGDCMLTFALLIDDKGNKGPNTFRLHTLGLVLV